MRRFRVEIDGKVFEVKVEEVGSEEPPEVKLVASEAPRVETNISKQKVKAEGNIIVAPMMGTIIDIFVKPGDKVKEGQPVAKLEAMKLEMDIVSDLRGKVAEVHVKKGASVQSGDLIISFE